MGRVKIYLGDMVHNHIGKGPWMFPVNIGSVAAYCQKKFGADVESKLFKFPDHLLENIKNSRPHIIGLSNYCWNLDLSDKIMQYVKSVSPNTICVMGGPNFHADKQELIRNFLEERPWLDIYVLYQGETGFSNIVGSFLAGSSCPEKLKQKPLDGCVFYDRGSRDSVMGNIWEVPNFNDIPSPYLTGILDPFFEDYLIPQMETNRGCPFSCTYCAWGSAARKKIQSFSLERVKEELDYIVKKVNRTDVLSITDANFGILKRDFEIAQHIRSLRDLTGYPRRVVVAWAKNKADWVIKIAEELRDMVYVTASFQTMSDDATKYVKRENIDLADYEKIQNNFIAKDIETASELILGLPGETRQSHLEALRALFDMNTPLIICYNCYLFYGTELDAPDSRGRFKLKSKFRLLDNAFGSYGDIKSVEYQEVVTETNTMKEEEILYFRPLHWLIQFCWNYKYYYELLKYLQSKEINPVDYLTAVIDNAENAASDIKALFMDFKKDAASELFPSKKDFLEYYYNTAHFDSLAQGEFGKLNYIYTLRVLFECKNSFENLLFDAAYSLVESKVKSQEEDPENLLKDIIRFTEGKVIDLRNGLLRAEVEKKVRFEYDLKRWKEERFMRPLADYHVPGGIEYIFFIPDDQFKSLSLRLKGYESFDNKLTLRKMVEYMRIEDLFYKVRYSSEAPLDER